jgi:hypothetical protein
MIMDRTVGDGYLAVLIKDGSYLRLALGACFVLGSMAEPTICRLVPHRRRPPFSWQSWHTTTRLGPVHTYVPLAGTYMRLHPHHTAHTVRVWWYRTLKRNQTKPN